MLPYSFPSSCVENAKIPSLFVARAKHLQDAGRIIVRWCKSNWNKLLIRWLYIEICVESLNFPSWPPLSSFSLLHTLPPSFHPAELPAFCPCSVAFPEERPACRCPSGGGWCIFDEWVLGTLWRAAATTGQRASLRFPAGRHRHCCSFCGGAGETGLKFQPGGRVTGGPRPNRGQPDEHIQVLLSRNSWTDDMNIWVLILMYILIKSSWFDSFGVWQYTVTATLYSVCFYLKTTVGNFSA